MTVDSYMCPTCGAEVKVGAACPGCVPKKRSRKKRVSAAPKKRSWDQDSMSDGVDIPDEDFDYDEFVQREFGNTPHKQIGIKWYWWATAVALAVSILVLLMLGVWF